MSVLELLFLSEEDAFWALVCILDCIMPPDYYSPTLMAAQTDQVGGRQGGMSVLELLFLSEEDAFWALVCILDCIMPPDYYSPTLMAAQTDQVGGGRGEWVC